jgi:peptidoglycan/LPS O-acetylase OafA/YrhL
MTIQQPQLEYAQYRPDIDGLRAIAVLAVVAFHAFPDWARGGFIGVDIFFVISGYLISTIIFTRLAKGTFSFTEFYSRRIKRIFPALILVLVACFIFGWFALFADEYKQLGKDIAAGAVFISNIVIRQEFGYFDNAATKPLLHLWSLGIEEQFYIIWPLLLWLAWRYKCDLLSVTLVLAIGSFMLNINGIKQDLIATFCLPQTRFWELLSGSVLAWIDLYKQDAFGNIGKIDAMQSRIVCNYGKTLANIISLLGLLLLAYGFWRINQQLNFPGAWALVPVLGSMLIIAAGRQSWVNRRILSLKVAVWFGLISFPLYLWHYPLLTFARIIAGKIPSLSIRIVAVALAVVLAWLTYKFVECPIRFRTHKQSKLTVTSLVVLMSIIGLLGYNTYKQNGMLFSARVKNNLINSSMLNWSSVKSVGCEAKLGTRAEFCLELGNKEQQSIAVIGDSTANAIAPGLYKQFYADKNEGLINFGQGTCPPIRGLVANTNWGGPNTIYAKNCANVVNHAYSYIINNPKIKTVVLVMFAVDLPAWGIPHVTPNDSLATRFSRAEKLLNDDIKELLKAGKKVIVSYDMPAYPIDAHLCLTPFGKPTCSVAESDLLHREPLELFNNFFKDKADICVVQAAKVLIVKHKAALLDNNGVLMLRDDHHLSYNGSDIVAREYQKQGCIVSN